MKLIIFPKFNVSAFFQIITNTCHFKFCALLYHHSVRITWYLKKLFCWHKLIINMQRKWPDYRISLQYGIVEQCSMSKRIGKSCLINTDSFSTFLMVSVLPLWTSSKEETFSRFDCTILTEITYSSLKSNIVRKLSKRLSLWLLRRLFKFNLHHSFLDSDPVLNMEYQKLCSKRTDQNPTKNFIVGILDDVQSVLQSHNLDADIECVYYSEL